MTINILLRTVAVDGINTLSTEADTLEACLNNFTRSGVSMSPLQIMEIVTVDYSGVFPVRPLSLSEVRWYATQDKNKREQFKKFISNR